MAVKIGERSVTRYRCHCGKRVLGGRTPNAPVLLSLFTLTAVETAAILITLIGIPQHAKRPSQHFVRQGHSRSFLRRREGVDGHDNCGNYIK
jgi:hypothetical protein